MPSCHFIAGSRTKTRGNPVKNLTPGLPTETEQRRSHIILIGAARLSTESANAGAEGLLRKRGGVWDGKNCKNDRDLVN